jgi:crotonobetainyl-CoA:carnitine CoA-transferase CaiB-like acyl-CoA transferase
MTAPQPGALDGVRILDFTQMMLGPFATQLLGDLGADVIKVERPGSGEWERGLEMGGRLLAGTSAAFLAMNRNKRSLALDLKAPGARDVVLALVGTCDVVVENFRPGVMERLGLGYDDLRAVRPDLVYCSGSGWGQDTRYAREGRPGQDLLVQAMSGLAANAGRRGEPPVIAGSSISDATTALTLANGILAALFARERQGIGQRVEVGLFTSTITVMCQEIVAMTNQGQPYERSEAGIAQPWSSAPYGVYATADGWVAIAMAGPERLAEAFDEPGFASLDLWEERDAVKRRIDELAAPLASDVLVERLLAAGLWAARVRGMGEAVDELRADGSPLLVTVDDPVLGELELVGCPITLSATPWRVARRPPHVGEHTDEVLSELLDDARIAALRAAAVIA